MQNRKQTFGLFCITTLVIYLKKNQKTFSKGFLLDVLFSPSFKNHYRIYTKPVGYFRLKYRYDVNFVKKARRPTWGPHSDIHII